jgi:hypothetical protein
MLEAALAQTTDQLQDDELGAADTETIQDVENAERAINRMRMRSDVSAVRNDRLQ